jgi:hypothetical protein
MPNYNPDYLENNTQYFWKVVARDESQAETTGPIWTFTTNDCNCDPPEKPQGRNQIRNRNRNEYSTKLMIQNQDGIYYNFSWGDGNCSDWLGPYNFNERVRAEHQWQEPGEYQVQARARFQNNNNMLYYNEWITTGWSEPLTVTVTEGSSENQPPIMPSINGQANGKAGESYDYTFMATDPEGDDIYYYVEFCEGCHDAQWHGPFPSGYELTITHYWESQGEYTIKSKAKDVYDAEGEWGTLGVSMPRARLMFSIMQRIMQRLGEFFPNFPFFFY